MNYTLSTVSSATMYNSSSNITTIATTIISTISTNQNNVTTPSTYENTTTISNYTTAYNTTYYSDDYDDYEVSIVDIPHCDDGVDTTSFGLITLYSTIFFLGLFGNIIVLTVLRKYKIKTIQDMFLLNLTLSDLIFVLVFPFNLYDSIAKQWSLGDCLCKFKAMFYFVGFYNSMSFITLMSIDRYLAVVHPVKSMPIRTKRYGIVLSMVVWIVSTIESFPIMLFYETKKVYGITYCHVFYNDNAKIWKLFINFEINIFGMIIPLTILLYCYYKILNTLKTSQTKNKKAIKMVFLIVICSVLFLLPFSVTVFVSSLYLLNVFSGCMALRFVNLAVHVAEIVSLCHCFINPLIYAFCSREFTKKLLRLRSTSSAGSISIG
ncbi:CC chemokine receptor-like protein [Lumpy skin disease virus]|uniref:CC chemokine receptor-like protein n=65 Tax=Lumpy skin disease virus TaxID=59509 RepID=A0A023VVU1_LSDV|nr:CC chemokine receptor-like protein [Lumpy skin disease virus NW-LW]ACO56291.1 G-protein-coupled chemokine receptor [Lumpy skin disease virus Burkina Banfora]ACO56305.1 G-protein-coupled chemokine receptor [Lumpy skin disease virus Niger Tougounous]ACO56306.1 G-protein-coupled chemokine receptor [Lumpy skin disease virus Sudan/99 Atbara]ACO56307.1 G-protein-coupled chemokine receptor [Lumpy skin disease virus vaccine Nigeria]ACO56308.1 G-protein-coupled chemokine receptor [Lumpy skin disease